MKIAIITPVYLATEKTIECCQHIDQNTSGSFRHVLVDDSSPSQEHKEALRKLAGPKRDVLFYDDLLPPAEHRANITKAIQTGYNHLMLDDYKFDYLFVVESDVMVPQDWDKLMVQLSQILPEDWLSLDVMPVDEEDKVTYPAAQHTVAKEKIVHNGAALDIIEYGDWNAILLNPKLVEKMNRHEWRFDEVPSHHDILLSRKFLTFYPNGKFYRTPDVRAIHFPNSSRSMLPEGLKTPSNPR